MAKQRFRDTKKGKIIQKAIKKSRGKGKSELLFAKKRDIAKAFLTDSFMLLMPIMYIVFYVVFSGREGFGAHKLLGWLYILIPLIVVELIFLAKSAQTPGMRAYNLKLIFLPTKEKPPVTTILLRQILAKFTFLFFGWIIWLFRKDGRNIHDLIVGTALVYDSKDNS